MLGKYSLTLLYVFRNKDDVERFTRFAIAVNVDRWRIGKRGGGCDEVYESFIECRKPDQNLCEVKNFWLSFV